MTKALAVGDNCTFLSRLKPIVLGAPLLRRAMRVYLREFRLRMYQSDMIATRFVPKSNVSIIALELVFTLLVGTGYPQVRKIASTWSLNALPRCGKSHCSSIISAMDTVVARDRR